MPRFVVRYRGSGQRPQDAVDRIGAVAGARVIDDAGPMLLVDAPREDDLRAALDNPTDWLVAPEVTYPIPDTRKRIERPPEDAA